MSESLAARYQSIPYPSFVHEFTHPALLGATARLFGLPCADPRRARVLELATGRGRNILWIARTLGESQCVAIDLVAEGFAEAQQAAVSESLDHLQYIAADLLNCDLGDQRFDYIIAHGFLSWTLPKVQQRIFEVCRDHLAANGVALISYNALPGFATADALRQLFLLERGEERLASASSETQLNSADRVLRFFESAVPETVETAHAQMLQQNVQAIRKKHPGVLLHDECGEVNDPLYLLQFTQWAAENGLAYVADTELRCDWIQSWPRPLRKAVVDFQLPRLKALQYGDYVLNPSLRRSLVCRNEDAGQLKPMPDEAALDDLFVTSHLKIPGLPPASPDSAIRYESTHRQSGYARPPIEVSDSVLKRFLHVVGHEVSRPYAEVRQQVVEQLSQEFDADSAARLSRFVLECCCEGRMQLSLGPAPKSPA